MENQKDKEKFVLNKETDFTSSALVSFLNEKYKTKKTGQVFTSGDVQQYLRRGFLPKPYGNHPLQEIVIEEIGITLIRVDFKKTKKSNCDK